jgi:hypothetical protein
LFSFETFDDVREVLEKEAAGWLAAFGDGNPVNAR